MLRKAGPPVHFEEQFGDLDMRQRGRYLIDQALCRLRYRSIERRDLQARVGKNRIRQIVSGGQLIDYSEFSIEDVDPFLEIALAVGVDGQWEFAGSSEHSEPLGRHQVFVEVFELPRALDPYVSRAKRVLELR